MVHHTSHTGPMLPVDNHPTLKNQQELCQ